MHSRVRSCENLIWDLCFNFRVASFTVSIIVWKRWNVASTGNCEVPNYSKPSWTTFWEFPSLFICPVHLPSHPFPGSLYALASLLFRRARKEDKVCHRFVWNACRRRHSKISCWSESFGKDVLKNQLCCLTSCGDHLIKHLCRHHASVKFERIEISLMPTFSVGSQAIACILNLRPTNSRMTFPAISSLNISRIILFVPHWRGLSFGQLEKSKRLYSMG